MNRRALLLLPVLVPVLAISSGAFAQPAPMTPETYWGELKKHMHIKPHQDAAWKKYSSAVRQAAVQSGGHDSTMFEKMGTASWHERCNMMNRTLKGPEATETARKAAAELTPMLDQEQKAEAPATLPGFALPPGPGVG